MKRFECHKHTEAPLRHSAETKGKQLWTRRWMTNNLRIRQCSRAALQLAEVEGDSRVRIQGEIVVQFDYSGMVQLLVYPVFPARMPARK